MISFQEKQVFHDSLLFLHHKKKSGKPNYDNVRQWFNLSARRIRSSNTYYVNANIAVVLKPYATLYLPGAVFVPVSLWSRCKELVSHEKEQNVRVESTSDNFFTNNYFVALCSQGAGFFQNPFSHGLTLIQVWFCFSQYKAVPGVLPVEIL